MPSCSHSIHHTPPHSSLLVRIARTSMLEGVPEKPRHPGLEIVVDLAVKRAIRHLDDMGTMFWGFGVEKGPLPCGRFGNHVWIWEPLFDVLCRNRWEHGEMPYET